VTVRSPLTPECCKIERFVHLQTVQHRHALSQPNGTLQLKVICRMG
jgi:hypothetical protein